MTVGIFESKVEFVVLWKRTKCIIGHGKWFMPRSINIDLDYIIWQVIRVMRKFFENLSATVKLEKPIYFDKLYISVVMKCSFIKIVGILGLDVSLTDTHRNKSLNCFCKCNSIVWWTIIGKSPSNHLLPIAMILW